jgi:chromosome segregation ATPase
MLSGLETLQHLDGALQDLRKELDIIDRELQAVSTVIARSQLQQSEILKRLAALRLDAISSNEVGDQIDATERRVQDILAQREAAIADISQAVADCTRELGNVESERTTLHTRVDEAAKTLAEREANVQAALADDAEFRTQLERTEATDAVAVGAAEKARVASHDSDEKSRPYDADPLFTYLWRRGFGTSEYHAGPLTRALDRWVARLCRYPAARANYWTLREIPKRLEQHAANVRSVADAELAKLQTLEARAAEAGGVSEAAAALAAIEAKQDEADDRIAALEQRLGELQSQQGRYTSGDDEYFTKCLATLEAAMKLSTLADLANVARATMTLEDDALVDQLREAQVRERGLRSELEEHRKIHLELTTRLKDVTDVRQQFKQRRYDDLRSGFDNKDLVLMILGQVLAGTVRGGSLWDALRRHQRYRDVAGAWPDFGSGGVAGRIGRSPRGGRTWHWPGKNGGSGSGFKLPKSGGRGRGRGGFRTGGGF